MPLGQGHTGDKLTDSKASAICAMWPDALLRIWQQLSRETNRLSFLPARDIFVLCISHGRLVAKATTSTPTWLDSKQICFLLTGGSGGWGGPRSRPSFRAPGAFHLGPHLLLCLSFLSTQKAKGTWWKSVRVMTERFGWGQPGVEVACHTAAPVLGPEFNHVVQPRRLGNVL